MADDVKVITEHAEANDAIKLLREIAKVLKEVGDENVQLKEGNERIAALEDQLSEARLEVEEAREDRAEHGEWRELLEDFRSGIRDSDELIERTVGKL